ncbi:MAG: IS30 family transposase, partial [Rhizobiaceae bacterium]|nr:IS30 family transposase [Rhizobiaceae bacterium]
MKYRQRTFYTDKQKSEMWDRWQRGESMSSIGRGFDRASSSIYPLLARTGGIRPPDRMRSRLALTLIDREEISRGLRAKVSLRSIARTLKRPASTISREVGRNGGVRNYRATASDAAAWDRAHRPKPCKLAGNIYLCRAISAKMTRKWSPQQIAGWLMREHPNEEGRRVSHETIYRSLFIQTRGVLKKQLLAHLRATRSIRRSRHATLKRSGLGQFDDAVSTRDRPAEVEDRAVPGHHCRQGMRSMPERREGDLIAGSGNSFIATLVERHTRYVMLAKVGNKDSHSVIQALIKQSRKLPKELYRSLTWDRGSEMAGHKSFTLATD